MRALAVLLLTTLSAPAQNAIGPLDLGKRWAGREFKDAQRALSGHVTLFVYWGAGPDYTKAAPALVGLSKRHADKRLRMILTAPGKSDWKPLIGTLWSRGMAWRPHNVTYDFELRKAYADRGKFIEVIPEKEHPYPILIVMAEHIALMGGVK